MSRHTDLASSIPHGDGVIVGGGDSCTSRVGPTDLSTVVLDVL